MKYELTLEGCDANLLRRLISVMERNLSSHGGFPSWEGPYIHWHGQVPFILLQTVGYQQKCTQTNTGGKREYMQLCLCKRALEMSMCFQQDDNRLTSGLMLVFDLPGLSI